MARPLRLEFAGALYHVTSRGDRREDIYLDDDDRQAWLSAWNNRGWNNRGQTTIKEILKVYQGVQVQVRVRGQVLPVLHFQE